MNLTGRKMTLEISNKRRQEIKEHVYHILVLYGFPVLPVKIGSIIRNIRYIKLITYSSQIKKYGISYDELILDAETRDSYAVRQGSTGRYCIYYNDIDPNIVTSNRVRWNLAHELGHIVLKHHEIAGLEKLYRNGIDDITYQYLEKEADYFAQLILVPHAALLGFRIDNSRNIRIMCKISEPAAKRRYYQYMEWKQHIDAQDEYDKRIFYFYFNFIFKRKCRNCGASLIQRHGKYCPICGQKNTLQWGDGEMIYQKLDTYDDNKLIECPTCQNEETDLDGPYCQICGEHLVNHCTNDLCMSNLPSNARYCPICGSYSSFYQRGILKSWDYKESSTFLDIPIPEDDEELPFA